mmetsp:Transcript_155528/g.274646  ORF Transcript_155528/g.274646 Transcript_155528/m.274646 type:complete len:216 (+) Transcript_155528:698-1345(+)
MRAPANALCFTNSTFARSDSPPVSSLIRFSRKGVTSLPVTPSTVASSTALRVASSTTATSAASAAGIGLPTTIPDERPSLPCAAMISDTSFSESQIVGTGRPDEGVKKAGNILVRKPITTTPCVSKYSIVLGRSRIDFAPAQTTVTGVRPSSVRSAETSHDSSAPRCTPPMPPVTKTLMPAMCAMSMVAETVVAPSFCRATTVERSRRETLTQGV